MSFGDSNRVKLAFVEESSFGVTPTSATFKEVRLTSESLSHTKQTVVSEELRSDRMRSDVIEVGASAEGEIQFELSFNSFNDLFEAALQGTFVEVSTTASATFVSTDVTLGSAIVGSLEVGQFFRIENAGPNSGIFRVAAKPDGQTIRTDAVFSSAAVYATALVRAKTLKNGTTSRSFTLQREYEDLGLFFRTVGMKCNTMSLEIGSGAIVNGSFGFMGKEGTYASSTIASAISAAPTTNVLNATANVGNIYEGSYAAPLATALQSISLQLTNNQRNQGAVGNRTPVGIGEGSIEISGTINAYFENILLAQKFISHTASSLSFRFTDASGNVMIFTLPKVYYSSGNAPATGINTDIMLPLEFMTARDPTSAAVIRIDVLGV